MQITTPETFKHEGKNVPEAIEVTFLLNTLMPEKKHTDAKFPIPNLDQPCDRLKEDIVFRFFLLKHFILNMSEDNNSKATADKYLPILGSKKVLFVINPLQCYRFKVNNIHSK